MRISYFQQIWDLNILRVDFNFSYCLKKNKTNSGKITCQDNRSVLSVPSLTLRAILSHFSTQHPNLQVVWRGEECTQLRCYSYSTVQPENTKIHRVTKHSGDEGYACDKRFLFYETLFPTVFLHCASGSTTKQPFHTRNSDCNPVTFLLAKSSY